MRVSKIVAMHRPHATRGTALNADARHARVTAAPRAVRRTAAAAHAASHACPATVYRAGAPICVMLPAELAAVLKLQLDDVRAALASKAATPAPAPWCAWAGGITWVADTDDGSSVQARAATRAHAGAPRVAKPALTQVRCNPCEFDDVDAARVTVEIQADGENVAATAPLAALAAELRSCAL